MIQHTAANRPAGWVHEEAVVAQAHAVYATVQARLQGCRVVQADGDELDTAAAWERAADAWSDSARAWSAAGDNRRSAQCVDKAMVCSERAASMYAQVYRDVTEEANRYQ